MADLPPSTGPDRPLARWQRFIGAWQPFTGRGVAAFAAASTSRLLTLQILSAAALACLVVASLRQTLFPTLEHGLAQLPDQASLNRGHLDWPGTTAVRLAENPWFDWVVTPESADPLGQTADFQFELRPDKCRINGAFGHLDIPWVPGWELDLGRIPATSTWGAWRLPVQAIVGATVFGGLIASWWILATLWVLPAWVGCRSAGRKLRLGSVWKMAGAALLAGAAVAGLGLAGYTTGRWHLAGLLVSQGLHLMVGWLWLAWGIVATPRGNDGKAAMPPVKDTNRVKTKGRKPRTANPFHD